MQLVKYKKIEVDEVFQIRIIKFYRNWFSRTFELEFFSNSTKKYFEKKNLNIAVSIYIMRKITCWRQPFRAPASKCQPKISTLSCTKSQNYQTHFKSLSVNTSKVVKGVRLFWDTMHVRGNIW